MLVVHRKSCSHTYIYMKKIFRKNKRAEEKRSMKDTDGNNLVVQSFKNSRCSVGFRHCWIKGSGQVSRTQSFYLLTLLFLCLFIPL